MGSGRLLAVGSLTAKMLLYLASLATASVALLLGARISIGTCYLIAAFALLAGVSSIIGLLNGAKMDLLMIDLRLYAYIPALCFFDLAIRSQQAVDLVSKAIRIASVVMLLVCASIIVLVLSGELTVIELLRFVTVGSSEDVMASQEGIGIRFFYKGYIYLGVGVLFWASRPGWRAKIIAGCALGLIVLSGTRGLSLAVIICWLMAWALASKKKRAVTRLVAAGILIAVLAASPYLVSVLRGGDQISASNDDRLLTIRQVEAQVTPGSLFWGHGLGVGVPARREHMEITYLEFLHKNGLVGLAIWLSLLALVLGRYLRLQGSAQADAAVPFVSAVLLIAIDTFSNPTLNNPIGLSVVFITLGVLGFLGNIARRKRLPLEPASLT